MNPMSLTGGGGLSSSSSSATGDQGGDTFGSQNFGGLNTGGGASVWIAVGGLVLALLVVLVLVLK